MFEIVNALEQLVDLQEKKMLSIAREIYPQIVLDDLWQPNDFPLLENNVYFRYEEGVREGLLSAKAALLAKGRERECIGK